MAHLPDRGVTSKARALTHWDAARWRLELGPVELQVGSSSSDIRLTTTLLLAD